MFFLAIFVMLPITVWYMHQNYISSQQIFVFYVCDGGILMTVLTPLHIL